MIGGGWVKAEQVKAVAQYGIELQLAQCAAGLGSDGTPMPPLKGSGVAVFGARVNGRVVFQRQAYAQAKVKLGLQPIRDLRGPGKDGHMLDDVRINYLDNKQATISITTRASRVKALANEQRAPWWGWSPASVHFLTQYAAQVYGQGTLDYLMSLGLAGASMLAGAGRLIRKVA